MNKNLVLASAMGIVIACALATSLSADDQKDPTGHTYVDSKQCKLCHNKPGEGRQYAVWKELKHSQAYQTLLSDEAKEIASSKGLDVPPSEAAECLRCHVTGYDVETKSRPEQLTLTDGIHCDTCHGPGSGHMADGKILRTNKEADIDVMANLLLPDKSTCVQCHNAESPSWNPEKYTLESGEKTGFDFEQAAAIIAHKNPKKGEK